MSETEDNIHRLPIGSSHINLESERMTVGSDARGGGGGPMGPNEYVTRETLNLTIDSIRSQIDARFAEVRAESRQDLVVQFLAILAVLIGLLAFGGDRFDGGVMVSSAVSQVSAENRELQERNALAIEALATQVQQKDDQIDALITALELQATRDTRERSDEE